MSKTYRVAVIGSTGKGDYGHGIDTVWKDIPDVEWSPSPMKTRTAWPRPPEVVADQTVCRLSGDAGRGQARHRGHRPAVDRPAPRHGAGGGGARHPHLHGEAVLPHAGRGRRNGRRLREDARQAGQSPIRRTTAPRLQVVKELIADGKIGQVLEFRGRGKEDQPRRRRRPVGARGRTSWT